MIIPTIIKNLTTNNPTLQQITEACKAHALENFVWDESTRIGMYRGTRMVNVTANAFFYADYTTKNGNLYSYTIFDGGIIKKEYAEYTKFAGAWLNSRNTAVTP